VLIKSEFLEDFVVFLICKKTLTSKEAELTIAELQPCTGYRLEISSLYKDFYAGEMTSAPLVAYFRTKSDGKAAQPLRQCASYRTMLHIFSFEHHQNVLLGV
jgi:hypothetical protein